MSKVKFGIVGCGFIGKRHAKLIAQDSRCDLVAICDINTNEEVFARDMQVPFFTSLESLLLEDFDVLCICTPNGLHARHALAGIRANKHCLVEKPMGLSKQDCEEVVHAALQKNKRVFCVMQNRYSPPSRWLKEIVDKGILGTIHILQIECFWNRDDRYYFPNGEKHQWKGTLEMDGGTLFTQFSHFIDILYWVFGDVRNIKSRFYNFTHKHSIDFEDSGFISFDLKDGGTGSLHYSTSVHNQNFGSTLTVIGEHGTVKLGGQYMNEVLTCDIANYDMPVLEATNPANDYGTYKGSAANHVYVFNNVIEVLSGNHEITTNALDGLKVVEIIERVYRQRKLSEL